LLIVRTSGETAENRDSRGDEDELGDEFHRFGNFRLVVELPFEVGRFHVERGRLANPSMFFLNRLRL
jgi:hypothetical protein